MRHLMANEERHGLPLLPLGASSQEDEQMGHKAHDELREVVPSVPFQDDLWGFRRAPREVLSRDEDEGPVPKVQRNCDDRGVPAAPVETLQNAESTLHVPLWPGNTGQ